jgi:YesN/AraC family two-component response regulator
MFSILIADEDRSVCQTLYELLIASDISVLRINAAHNVRDALGMVRNHRIDLLISEVRSDGLDGTELIRKAKKIQPWIQSIVVSANQSFQSVRMAMRSGATDYLTKPVNGDLFVESVRNVMLKAQCQSAQREEWMDQAARLPSQGPCFSVLHIKMVPPSDVASDILENDRELRRTAFRLTHLCLAGRRYIAFLSSHDVINIILQWDEGNNEEIGHQIIQMKAIGRRLSEQIRTASGVGCTVGISQVLRGIECIGLLYQQAKKAAIGRSAGMDSSVYYYGDWVEDFGSPRSDEEPGYAGLNRIVEEAKAYIQQNYHQKGLTLQSVARKNHVSPNYLSYLFKKYTGFNFWEYVTQLRMEESRKLILHTDLLRYEIAERVGYESPEHFSKIFKKKFGISPSMLKNKERPLRGAEPFDRLTR